MWARCPLKDFRLINQLLGKVFGTKNERVIKALMPKVQAINALEPQIQKLTDDELRAKTDEFRQRIQERLSRVARAPQADAPEGGADDEPDLDEQKQFEKREYEAIQEVLDEILVEAFAVVREAGRRVLNMRHFDVQLIGGMVQHQGTISEMKTGEGKTLVATLPVYLNALSGRGVHVVTVNDYLAKRDSEWMGRLYRFLGLTVGVIVHDLDDEERRAAYAADVTYGTNNEFGFDYLRDNMKFDIKDCVQRGHNYAIVDEVDSILIDEARTPLIISGASEESTDKYYKVNRIIPKLEKGEELEVAPGEPAQLTGDFVVDEKHRNITVTDVGWEKVEGLLGIGNIADPENWPLKHHVETAIKAHALYRKDVEYVIKEGEVIIVDEFTGRMMPGRRWSDGLHQAIEAKEGISTGISAHDRAHTISVAIDPTKGPADITSPGHVFPLVARHGGALVRAGHTEAAVDIARLAGLNPAGVICEIMNDDGTMARLPDLVPFAQLHGLKIGTIADLIAYRRKYDHFVKRTFEGPFQSHNGGDWRMIVYVNELEYAEHIALVKGDITTPEPVLVRMNAVNIFSDMLAWKPYERDVLGESMRIIAEEGRGVVVLLRSTRPTFVTDVVSRKTQDDADRRRVKEYGVGAQILLDLGIENMILLTDTPEKKIVALDGYGLNIVGTHPIRNRDA